MKEACLRLKVGKTRMQEVGMIELVAAAGMWNMRCDALKRDVMEQIKGLGDRMD